MSALFDDLRVGSLLKDLQAALRVLEKINVCGAEPEVDRLVDQVGDLIHITDKFHQLATTERRQPTLHLKLRSPNAVLHLQEILHRTTIIVDECTTFARPLRSSLEGFKHKRDLAGYLEPEHRLENQAWYKETYDSLKLLTELLRALFTAISLLQYEDDTSEDPDILRERSHIATTLHFEIVIVEERLHNSQHDTREVRDALLAAKAVTVHIPPAPNQHFVIPREVRTYYTGREAQLAKLEAAFRDPTLPTQQVFVIYGLSGSGKTELAFRFAEEHRQKFWGVFYVDGTSEKHAATSYATIATIGGVAPNDKAAKHWLVTRSLPWLLILDNVDEDKIKVRELLPQGRKGCCIITTRNPAHIDHGNAGDRYLELLPMEPEEAETLIIKAAEEPKPWPVVVKDFAKTICHALGFLPLALDQAAKAIRYGVCNWADYLIYFDHQTRRIRRNLHSRSKSRSRERRPIQEDKHSINVFSTYEILYESLESSPKQAYQDAIELLHVFSYFHHQNIRLDILVNSATNPLKENNQQKEDESKMKDTLMKVENLPRKPFIMFLREVRAFARSVSATPTPLPQVLRNRDRLGLEAWRGDVIVRLGDALKVLIGRSLVMRTDRTSGQCSMHPLIHKWVRERPEMSTSHQALWCQISMTTLAFSIQRPPHGDNEKDSRARRELLPHVRHVRQQQKEIESRLEENAESAGRVWIVAKSYGRLEVEQDVRFSRVYGETGQFDEARRLQERALEFVSRRLGADHPISIGLTLLVSQSLFELSEIDLATQCQRRAHRHCMETWGEHHPLTLDVTDMLGSMLYFKGRWNEAQSLHLGNIGKLKKLYGENHEKVFKSMRNSARLHYRWMEYEEATAIYKICWEGMKKAVGTENLETLFCMEELAMSYLRYEQDNLGPHRIEYTKLSHQYMELVYEGRKKQLGVEHHYTLLALLYFARAKSELGHHAEAEGMIKAGLTVAERNIPKDHIAFTLAHTIYAQVFMNWKKYDQAEKVLLPLVNKTQYSRLADADGDHPDRLTNLWLLTQCLEAQGKLEDALQRCEEFLAGLATVGGKGAGLKHVTRLKIEKKIPQLRERIGDPKARTVGEEEVVGVEM